MRQARDERSIYAVISEPVSPPYKTIAFKLVSLGTLACFVAWLAVACYAIAYLISH
jgi:hypothetical protein